MRSSRDLRVVSLMVSLPVLLVIASLISITVITVYSHFKSWLQAFSTRELSAHIPQATIRTPFDTYTLHCLTCPIHRNPCLIDHIHATLCRLLSPDIYSFVAPNQGQSFSFDVRLPWMVFILLSLWILSQKLQPRYRTACMSFGQWSIRTATHASIFIFNKSFDYIGYISLSRRKYPDLTHNNTVDPANDPPLKLIQVKQNDNTVVRRKKEKSGRSRTKRSEARSHTSGFREPSVQAVHAIIGPPPAPSLETGSIDTRDNKPSPKPHPNDDNEWTIVRERSFKRRIGPSICHQDQPEKKGVENEPQTNKVVPDIKPDTRILPCDITSSILCKEDPNSVSETFEDRFQVESDGESTLNDDYDDETLDRSECSLLTADDVLILDDYSQTVTNTSKDLAFIYGENKQYLDPPCLSKEQAPKDNGMDSKLITEQKWYSPFSTGFNLVQLCDDSQRPWDCPRPPLVCKSLAEKPVSYFDHWSKNYVWGNPCIGIHSNEKAPLDSLLYKKPFLLPLPEAHSASLSKLNSPLHQSSISQNYILPFTNRRATSAPLLFSQSSTYLQTTYKPRHSTQNEGIKAHFL